MKRSFGVTFGMYDGDRSSGGGTDYCVDFECSSFSELFSALQAYSDINNLDFGLIDQISIFDDTDTDTSIF